MRRDTITQLFALLVLILSLSGAGYLVSTIDSFASSAQLRFTDQAAKGAPLAVTVAQSVGVLRGIVVNYLWIRTEKLKDQGKFFEAYSVAKWITQLQPRFAKVWQFQAWNMAYNISVATHTKEERWKWVQDGIRLIREHGIVYNPNDMMLYKELSWYFLHKIGGFTDDAHIYYKQQLADRWQGILGKPPYDEDARKQVIREIVDAPAYLEDIVSDHPETKQLIKDLKKANFRLDENLLRTIEWTRAINTSAMAKIAHLKESISQITDFSTLSEKQRNILEPVAKLRPIRENPEYKTVWPILIAHLRGKIIREEYNMDASYMLQYMDQFGPLDWRCASAHALYWAALGVEKGLTRENQYAFDRLNTDRLLFHSEQQLKFNGRIIYDFLTKQVSWGPDLRFIPYYENTFKIVLAREVKDAFGRGPKQNYIDGYRNFLIDTVREYYMWGEYDKAAAQYKKLRTDPMFFQANKPDRFTYDIKEFILRESVDRYESPQVAREDIFGLLVTAFRFGLARGNTKSFTEHLNTAKQIYDYFMENIAVTTIITKENRLGFPKWGDMVKLAFQYAMTTDQATTIEERMTLWANQSDLVTRLKLETYDQIKPSLEATFMQAGPLPLSFDQAFPAPPGIEQYRKQRGLTQPDSKKQDIKVEHK